MKWHEVHQWHCDRYHITRVPARNAVNGRAGDAYSAVFHVSPDGAYVALLGTHPTLEEAQAACKRDRGRRRRHERRFREHLQRESDALDRLVKRARKQKAAPKRKDK